MMDYQCVVLKITNRTMQIISKAYTHIQLAGSTVMLPGNYELCTSQPLKVSSYDELIRMVAKIGYFNRRRLWGLYFRGENKIHRKDRKITILPKIYRETDKDIKEKFEELDTFCRELVNRLSYEEAKVTGSMNIKTFPELQWAVLQHYEKYPTPLIDLSQSIHVACSFALDKNKNETGIIYVFGMPYIHDYISYFPSQNLLIIRLMSISPPSAERPFFQEGFMASHFPLSDLYDNKKQTQFDFSRRLIASFEIPNSEKFWGDGFTKIPHEKLYQPKDRLAQLVAQLPSDFI